MARPKAKAPARRYHIRGQSVVTIDGKDFYLGKHDSPEAIARYAVLISTYQQNGCRLPDSFDPDEIKDRAALLLGEAPQHQDAAPITVAHVTAAYREWATARAKTGSRKEFVRTISLCDELDQHAGRTLADRFGPLALQAQRQRWVNAGISRNYINKQANLLHIEWHGREFEQHLRKATAQGLHRATTYLHAECRRAVSKPNTGQRLCNQTSAQ